MPNQRYRKVLESLFLDDMEPEELAVEMNTPDLALLDLEEAAKLAPDDAEIYVMCGEIYLSQKKKREAYVAFEKAIELGVPRPELQDKLKASK